MNKHVKKGLIVFARKPVLGKVKTRLAATLGDKKALEIYIKLLHHTRSIVIEADCHNFAFLTEQDDQNFWKDFSCFLQKGNSLGDRMYEAFDLLFCKEYQQCIIIGSDCPALTTEIINEAFEKLNTNNFVIGEASDGGYYLLGMKKMHASIFKNKEWSTKNVFTQTLMDIKKGGFTYHLLPVLNDVDEKEDVPKEWL